MSYDWSTRGETDVDSYDVTPQLSFRSDPQLTDSSRAFKPSAQYGSSGSSSDLSSATGSELTLEQASHEGHDSSAANTTSSATPSAPAPSNTTKTPLVFRSDQAFRAACAPNLPGKASEEDLRTAKSGDDEEARDNSAVFDVVYDRSHTSGQEARGMNVVNFGLEANGEQYTAQVRLCRFAEAAPDLKLTDIWIDSQRAFRQTPRRPKSNRRYSHPA
ncbi:hypothetical protein AAVH_07794 [Aphelenchoides avenae]|nr:hypothetical protein AAVH_07794 [Aphelenchus avenae]